MCTHRSVSPWSPQHQLGGLRLPKVQRMVIADGEYCEVACAVRADGITSPAAQLLEELSSGNWPDPHAEELPDEHQVKLHRRLIAHAEQLANGEYLPPTAYNRLVEGIWELKVETVRLTFYDTDGEGHWTPKSGTSVATWDGRNRVELPEDFDEFLRLGHAFAKTSQRTLEADLQESMQVREEDVQHDARAS